MIIQPSIDKNCPNRFVIIFRDTQVGYIKIVDYIQEQGFFSGKKLNGYLYHYPTFEEFVKKNEIFFPKKRQPRLVETKETDLPTFKQPESIGKERLILEKRYKEVITRDDWNFLATNQKEFYYTQSQDKKFSFSLVFCHRTSGPNPALSNQVSITEPKVINFNWTTTGVQTLHEKFQNMAEFLSSNDLKPLL